ncbi:hypothetical protein KKF34_12280 [Myxococcota bacterium]|nr:hypothetical protein [Myxococcota bacterium]
MSNLFIIVVLLLAAGVFIFYKGGTTRGQYVVKSGQDINAEPDMPSEQDINIEPDMPVEFGYKCQWLAIKTDSADEVINKIKLKDVQVSSWKSGILHAYEDMVFVTPPVNGWVFVVGATLPDFADNRSKRNNIEKMLIALSLYFSEVQYFGSHRVVEYHAWAKAKNGSIVRGYAYLGEQGRTLWNVGEKSSSEIELGLNYFNENSPDADDDGYWEREDLKFPDEEHVMQIAGKWSINPMKLPVMAIEKGTGFLGKLR